ncbi:hypothetical protein [Mycobacterium sp. URHB0044]|uniref:hypothetical protein n=1 Tax=Mycobacterium sp. URHB0044 TaxID=1380386 RepID=UPI003510C311
MTRRPDSAPMPMTTRVRLCTSAATSGRYRVVGRSSWSKKRVMSASCLACSSGLGSGPGGGAIAGSVMSNPAWDMNFPHAAPGPSRWNVSMMSSVAARCRSASGRRSSSGGSCATSVRTRPG